MHLLAELCGNSAACPTDTTFVDLPPPPSPPPPAPSPPPKKHGETVVCDLCAKSFASQKTLKRHRRTVHRQSGGLSCRMCDQRFYRRDHHKKHHISKHADEEYEAPASYRYPICQKSFYDRGHLREHLKTHPATSSPATCPASPLPPPASALHAEPWACPVDVAFRVPEDCRQCFIENWSQIRWFQRGGKRVLVCTRRLETGSDIGDMLRTIFRSQKDDFKMKRSVPLV